MPLALILCVCVCVWLLCAYLCTHAVCRGGGGGERAKVPPLTAKIEPNTVQFNSVVLRVPRVWGSRDLGARWIRFINDWKTLSHMQKGNNHIVCAVVAAEGCKAHIDKEGVVQSLFANKRTRTP